MRHQMRLFMQIFIRLLLVLSVSACDTTMFTPLSALENPYAPPWPRSHQNYANLATAERNYQALQQALPIYENAVRNPWPEVPTDRVLKPGMKNKSVLALRERLLATGDLRPEEDHGYTLFDTALKRAVRRFQEHNGLDPDGVVGKDTLDALNISPQERLHQIEVNITRWEKINNDLGNNYILVNVPDYRLYYVEDGETVLTMKAIVGKPERPTPEITSTVTRLVFNPYWNVPNMIAERDIVPKVMKDPRYLDENHIRLFNRQDRNADELNPYDIDWASISENGFPYFFRQEPGADNALGLVKFEFQNSSDIYMHDTPAKDLFNLNKRAFSSGCIRLEKPFELVNYLMRYDPDWNEERIDAILSVGKPLYIKIPKPTKVIITYITVWSDEEGNLQFRNDLYGWDGFSGEWPETYAQKMF